MGLLRFYLALIVLMAHDISAIASSESGSALQLFSGIGGQAAVESFFVVSGFYIALILDTTYKKSPVVFYANRLLRIFPMYWTCLVAYILLVRTPVTLTPHAWLSNVFLIGGDGFSQIVFPQSSVEFIVPPAWTLVLELLFYVIAPFVVRLNSKTLATLLATLLVIKILLVGAILHLPEPWNQRIFPLELPYFLAGILIFRFRGKLRRTVETNHWIMFASLTLALSGSIIRFLASQSGTLTELYLAPLLFVASTVLFIPYLMEWSKGRTWDRYLGELSFPIYLVHFGVMILFVRYRVDMAWLSDDVVALALLVTFTLLLSAALERLNVAVEVARARLRVLATQKFN
jgi:peptidoglycan/LPS O-acetylase OafA/YrhL